jgi:very-short-patch-repair endonuclease
LLAAGLAPPTVDRRVNRRRLRPLHQGVYVVGPVLVPRARELAAALACGPGAAVSHWSAAGLWEMATVRAGPVEVGIPHGDRRHPGIRIHRVGGYGPDEVTRLDRIPLTTPARTLLDLASVAAGRQLERTVAEALARRLVREPDVLALLERHGPRPGTRRLRAILAPGAVAPLTRSEAEELFLKLVREARLPAPEANVRVAGYEVDCYWRAARLVVEIDGFAFHSSARKFESDRRRDQVLVAAGVRVMRVTWRQLTQEPVAQMVRLAQALHRGA